ncbi:MAG: hypothetical protein GF317_07555 [Candidatus Lokiarchaeota archaeon]|nr:hypothetical protein [Candidatus Lokiarchaeota archaeon]MBD3199568.1 hypothetical protein [Candidatus Lokiarchaeota archaeon]
MSSQTLKPCKKKSRIELDQLPYSEILREIAFDFPPLFVLFFKIAYSNSAQEIVTHNIKAFHRKEGWYKAVIKLKNLLLINLREPNVHKHEIRADLVSITNLGKRVRESLKNTEFFRWIQELTENYFDTDQEFISAFEERVEKPSRKKERSAKIFRFNDPVHCKSEGGVENKFIVSYKEITDSTNEQKIEIDAVSGKLKCRKCMNVIQINIKPGTFKKYRRKRKTIVKTCTHCKPLETRRIKYYIDISEEKITDKEFLSDHDLLVIAEYSHESTITLTNTEKRSLEKAMVEFEKRKKLAKAKHKKHNSIAKSRAKVRKKKDKKLAKHESSTDSYLEEKEEKEVTIDLEQIENPPKADKVLIVDEHPQKKEKFSEEKELIKRSFEYALRTSIISARNRGIVSLDEQQITRDAKEKLHQYLKANQNYPEEFVVNIKSLFKSISKEYRSNIQQEELTLKESYADNTNKYLLHKRKILESEDRMLFGSEMRDRPAINGARENSDYTDVRESKHTIKKVIPSLRNFLNAILRVKTVSRRKLKLDLIIISLIFIIQTIIIFSISRNFTNYMDILTIFYIPMYIIPILGYLIYKYR